MFDYVFYSIIHYHCKQASTLVTLAVNKHFYPCSLIVARFCLLTQVHAIKLHHVTVCTLWGFVISSVYTHVIVKYKCYL